VSNTDAKINREMQKMGKRRERDEMKKVNRRGGRATVSVSDVCTINSRPKTKTMVHRPTYI